MKFEVRASELSPIKAPSNQLQCEQSLAQSQEQMRNQAKAARIVAVALLTSGGLGCLGMAAWVATHAEAVGTFFSKF